MKRGKNYKKALESFNQEELFSIEKALEILEKFPKAKFDESVQLSARLSIDAKKTEQQVRAAVDLPHGTGKTKKIAAITSTQTKEAKEAGADLIGEEDLVQKIIDGKESVDVIVATPEMMPKIAKFAKALGPKGLMPNPKTETVGPKVEVLIKSLKSGRITFKSDKTGNINQLIGKRSFGKEKLTENFKAFMEILTKSKPAGSKGKFIKNLVLSSTMSPGIKIAH